MNLLLLLVILTQFLDLLTTYFVLENGGIELNPLMAPIPFPIVVLIKVITVSVMCIILLLVKQKSVKTFTIGCIIIVTMYMYIIANNIYVLLGVI